MATNKRENIMCEDSQTKSCKESDNTSWADRSENYAAQMRDKNVFINTSVSDRFFIIKREEGTFEKVSPFLIQKSLKIFIEEPKCVKKLRSGDLFVEVFNSKQAQNILKCRTFGNIPVSVQSHITLNSSRGVISESDLLYVSESELLENLKVQNISAVRRITMKRENNIIPTKHIILTFAQPNIPKSVKAGYLECPVRPYIPNPLRCFQCQRYGHSKTSCRGRLTCALCGEVGHASEGCSSPAKCVNCHGDHPSYSKSCSKWKLEKEIQTVRTKQNLPYLEAKKIVEARTPTIGVSYKDTLTKSIIKKFNTIATQTETFSELSRQKLTNNTKEIQTQKPLSQSSQNSAPHTNRKTTDSPIIKQINVPKNINKLPEKTSKETIHKSVSQKTKVTQPSKNKRLNEGKHKLSSVKSSVTISNTLKKTSNQLCANDFRKNPLDEPALDLYASDLSESSDEMSTTSENDVNIKI